jgi:HEXXH motif-containing protein
VTFAHLRLSTEDIDDLAAGRPGSRLLSTLEAGQRTKRRLLLVAVQRALRGGQPSRLDTAMATLQRAARLAPAAVEDVVARPLMNAAAIRCLGVMRTGAPEAGDAEAMRFVSVLAATAAIRAGLRFELDVPIPDGFLVLPGIGMADDLAGAWATVRSDGTTVAIHSDAPTVTANSSRRWRAARTVGPTLGEHRPMELEDQDPARACFGYEPAPYLGSTDNYLL